MTDLLGSRDQEQHLAEQPKALQQTAHAQLCTPKLTEAGWNDIAPLFWFLALSLYVSLGTWGHPPWHLLCSCSAAHKQPLLPARSQGQALCVKGKRRDGEIW